jgi:hypothetical protein
MPLDDVFLADLDRVLQDRRWRVGTRPQDRPLKDEAIQQLDGAAVRMAAHQAHGNRADVRREIARQLLNARLLVPAHSAHDDDALLALVAGGAAATLLFGMVSGQTVPGMLASVMVAAVLAWTLWQRWMRRGRKAADSRRP